MFTVSSGHCQMISYQKWAPCATSTSWRICGRRGEMQPSLFSQFMRSSSHSVTKALEQVYFNCDKRTFCAILAGYADTGAAWRAVYEEVDFDVKMEGLFYKILPFYEQVGIKEGDKNLALFSSTLMYVVSCSTTMAVVGRRQRFQHTYSAICGRRSGRT